MIKNRTVSLGILSWKSHITLRKTLETYKRNDLFSLFDQNVIYFNEISDDDIKIANEFGLEYRGTSKNLGILGGTEELAKNMRSEYLLLLQNDCVLVDGEDIRGQLERGIDMLSSEKVDIMRLRHRFFVGEGFSDVSNYLRYYPIRKIDENCVKERYSITDKDFKYSFKKVLRGIFRPYKKKRMIGRSVYVEKDPDQLFPKYIKKEDDVFIVDSAVINYTDQSPLIKKDFLLNVLFKYCHEHPKKTRTINGMQVQETILNSRWWRKQHYKIGVCRGLFSHERFDRP
ncbi:MAG: hypothetical protein LBS34_00755 [Rickettsiales bacterium]|jgi:hypothetical protein|nr:hypothetical protein [Rickettsiales bacterium]